LHCQLYINDTSCLSCNEHETCSHILLSVCFQMFCGQRNLEWLGCPYPLSLMRIWSWWNGARQVEQATVHPCMEHWRIFLSSVPNTRSAIDDKNWRTAKTAQASGGGTSAFCRDSEGSMALWFPLLLDSHFPVQGHTKKPAP
jgi:hypothetical protein